MQPGHTHITAFTRNAMHPAQSAGFTLVEVLVALVVLSVGLLGIAGMITTALRTNDGAYLRTEANIMAYSMLDRMRTNRDAATQSDYDSSMGTASTTAPTSCLGTSANCTSAQLATWDIYEWKKELGENLPSGEGSITTKLNSVGVVEVTVTVQWNAARAEQALSKTSSSSNAATSNTSFSVTSGL